MRAIQCLGCNAHLAIPGARKCPRCGAAIPAVEITPAIRPAPAPAQSATLAAGAPQSVAGPLLGMLAALVIFGFIALIAYRVAVPSHEKIREQALSKALVACQFAIQSTAQYGGADMPPYVPNHAGAENDEFYFAWPTGSFEFTNGFGAKVRMSASCIGTLSTGKITALTINGKDVI